MWIFDDNHSEKKVIEDPLLYKLPSGKILSNLRNYGEDFLNKHDIFLLEDPGNEANEFENIESVSYVKEENRFKKKYFYKNKDLFETKMIVESKVISKLKNAEAKFSISNDPIGLCLMIENYNRNNRVLSGMATSADEEIIDRLIKIRDLGETKEDFCKLDLDGVEKYLKRMSIIKALKGNFYRSINEVTEDNGGIDKLKSMVNEWSDKIDQELENIGN